MRKMQKKLNESVDKASGYVWGTPAMTLEEIASDMGISGARVRQLEARAKRKFMIGLKLRLRGMDWRELLVAPGERC